MSYYFAPQCDLGTTRLINVPLSMLLTVFEYIKLVHSYLRVVSSVWKEKSADSKTARVRFTACTHIYPESVSVALTSAEQACFPCPSRPSPGKNPARPSQTPCFGRPLGYASAWPASTAGSSCPPLGTTIRCSLLLLHQLLPQLPWKPLIKRSRSISARRIARGLFLGLQGLCQNGKQRQ